MTILTEQAFFDVMDGKLIPPENQNKKDGGIVYEPTTPNWREQEERSRLEFIDNKRADYLDKRKPAGNKYDIWFQEDVALRFSCSHVNTLWEALDRWGEKAQVGCAVEELAELIVALQKHTNRTPTPETLGNILDEIADVEIMLAQMRMHFGFSDAMLAKQVEKKLAKLNASLKEKA